MANEHELGEDSKSLVDGRRYRVTWTSAEQPAAAVLSGRWLVVGPVDDALEAALAAHGAEVVRGLAHGTAFSGVVSALEDVADTLSLVQVLGVAGVEAPLWCVTRGAVSIGELDPLSNPAQAPIWGLGRVVSVEHPERWGGVIDLPAILDEQVTSAFVGALTGKEDQVAVRETGVFVRRLVRAETESATTWQPQGTILITGGTGAVGSNVARWVASRGAEHIVLASRRGSDDLNALRLRDELITTGARVTLASCDVRDRSAIAALLAKYPVNAVMHAAGTHRPAAVTDASLMGFDDVITPSIAGAKHLDELLAVYQLDAFVVFSSTAGVLGSRGRAAQAAAGAYLDALVERRRSFGLPATSIALVPWTDDEAQGLSVATPELAIAALQEALDSTTSSMIVADVDWNRFAAAQPSLMVSELLTPAPAGGEVLSLRQQVAQLPDAERDKLLAELVRTHLGGTQNREQSTVDGWRYRTTWKPMPDGPAPMISGTWLVVMSGEQANGRLATACMRALENHGADVVPVYFSDAHPCVVAQDVDLALGDVVADGVLSLVPLAENSLEYSVSLAQALGDAAVNAPLWMVTRGAVSVDRADAPPRPQQAEITGLGRVIGLEYPRRWGGLIDLPEQFDEPAAVRLVAALAGTGHEDQLAIRAGGMFARRLVRAPRSMPGWHPRGTILVTGQHEAVVRWLSRNGAEHLVLTEGTPELAAELMSSGTLVTLADCDVADKQALDRMLSGLRMADTEVNAVVHVPGPVPEFSVADIEAADFAAVIAARVAGAMNLDEAFPADTLDAFVMFSSVSGIWGGAGQGVSAAANAFVDALAERRRSKGLASASVSFGPWALGDVAAEEQLRRRGLQAMPSQLATSALGNAVGQHDTCLTVADVDWERFALAFTSARPRPLISELPEVVGALTAVEAIDPAESAVLRERLTGVSESDQHRVLIDMVRTQAAFVLGLSGTEEVEAGRAFRELGFDSLSTIELRNRIAAATGLQLPVELTSDHPTPVALTRHLRAEIIADAARAAAPLFEELDRLEATQPDGLTKARVATRLRALLNRWSDVPAVEFVEQPPAVVEPRSTPTTVTVG